MPKKKENRSEKSTDNSLDTDDIDNYPDNIDTPYR